MGANDDFRPAHKDATTGVHGVGAGIIAKVADIAVDANLSAAAQDAVSKRHTQGTDTALGTLGTKNPPIDADLVVLRDSTSSFALFTSTWTQIKAFLKAYFDTLYATSGSSHTQGTDTALGALNTKDPPIDADKFIFRDSVSSDGLVTATGTQLKAYLKAYLDTLYGKGNGHITFFPMSQSGQTQGTWETYFNDPAKAFNLFCYNTSGASGDQIDFKAWLDPGTYVFTFVYASAPSGGILKILIDGTQVGVATIDTYSAGAVDNNFGNVTGITVATGGLKTVSLYTNTKNASSSAYRINWSMFSLWRSA